MPLEPGLTYEKSLTVQHADTARHSGGETLPPVLSTPRMIGLLEQTAHAAVLPYLEPGQTTVGTLVNVKHLAATPVGMTVRFHAELLEIDRRRLVFKVEAWDEVEQVGEGLHERFIIDEARFIAKLEEKQMQMHPGTLKGAGGTEDTEKK